MGTTHARIRLVYRLSGLRFRSICGCGGVADAFSNSDLSICAFVGVHATPVPGNRRCGRQVSPDARNIQAFVKKDSFFDRPTGVKSEEYLGEEVTEGAFPSGSYSDKCSKDVGKSDGEERFRLNHHSFQLFPEQCWQSGEIADSAMFPGWSAQCFWVSCLWASFFDDQSYACARTSGASRAAISPGVIW